MIYQGRFTFAEMAEELERAVASNATWLETFSAGQKKRPDHEIETKRRRGAVLMQALEDYRRAADRDHKKQEQQHGQSLTTKNAPLPAQAERTTMHDENTGYRYGGQAR